MTEVVQRGRGRVDPRKWSNSGNRALGQDVPLPLVHGILIHFDGIFIHFAIKWIRSQIGIDHVHHIQAIAALGVVGNGQDRVIIVKVLAEPALCRPAGTRWSGRL